MAMDEGSRLLDVIVIGGGQAGLAVGYFLRRTGLAFRILDGQPMPGGAWQHGWDSLRLFSPASASSLPGWPMAASGELYPHRDEVIRYLAAYEQRYALPVQRPVAVRALFREAETLRVESDGGAWHARAVVSATGNWAHPVIPHYSGQDRFGGTQHHSAWYRSPGPFASKRVLVVGGGNSGAQIVADLAPMAEVTWSTLVPPTFLPDHVDGRFLFEQATARYQATKAGQAAEPPPTLGNIVAVPPVRAARDQGLLRSVGPFAGFHERGVIWPDGREQAFDAVIWCTGFRPALDHLRPLDILDTQGRTPLEGTHSTLEPRLWLVGYGEWTGFASATLIGVGRSARATVQEITAFFQRR